MADDQHTALSDLKVELGDKAFERATGVCANTQVDPDMAVAAVLALGIAFFIALDISGPQMAEVAGDLRRRAGADDYGPGQGRDGEMAASFTRMVRLLAEYGRGGPKMAQGDLTEDVTPVSRMFWAMRSKG
jgi:hypothetical protein